MRYRFRKPFKRCGFHQKSGFLLTAGLLLATALFGQSKRLDSLRTLVATGQPTEAYANALVALCETYRTAKPDSTLRYAQGLSVLPETKRFFPQKAQVHNACGYAYYFKADYPAALASFQKYFQYAEAGNDPRNMGFALNNQGNVLIEMGQYNKAREHYQKALPFFRAANDTVGIAMNHNNIAFISKDLGDYEAALANYFTALRLYEQKGASQYMATTLTSIGVVLHRKKDYTAAIDFMLKALAIEEKNGFDSRAVSLQALAQVYGDRNELDKAIAWKRKALSLYENKADLRQIALVKADIGELHARQQQHREALPYLEEAIRLNRQIANKRNAAQLYIMTATAHLQMQQAAKARPLLDSATVHLSATGNKEQQKLLYEAEIAFYEAEGDYRQALHYARLYNRRKDELLNEASLKAMSDMQVKYETEKKEKTIALLNRDNAVQTLALERNRFQLTQQELALAEAGLKMAAGQRALDQQSRQILLQQLDSSEKARNLFALQKRAQIQSLELKNQQLALSKKNSLLVLLSLLFVLAALLGYLLYRRYRLRQKARLQATLLQQRQEATMQILLAEEKERQRIATDLHDGIGQTMTAAWLNLQALNTRLATNGGEEAALVSKTSELVGNSCTEVRQVSHKMMPNALQRKGLVNAVKEFTSQFDEKLISVRLQADEENLALKPTTELILYRVIQECVNNVVKHAGATELDISIVNDSDGLDILVEDNGIGFSAAVPSEGIGLQNIRSRIQYLGGTVEWDNTGSGTVVAIHIPHQYE